MDADDEIPPGTFTSAYEQFHGSGQRQGLLKACEEAVGKLDADGRNLLNTQKTYDEDQHLRVEGIAAEISGSIDALRSKLPSKEDIKAYYQRLGASTEGREKAIDSMLARIIGLMDRHLELRYELRQKLQDYNDVTRDEAQELRKQCQQVAEAWKLMEQQQESASRRIEDLTEQWSAYLKNSALWNEQCARVEGLKQQLKYQRETHTEEANRLAVRLSAAMAQASELDTLQRLLETFGLKGDLPELQIQLDSDQADREAKDSEVSNLTSEELSVARDANKALERDLGSKAAEITIANQQCTILHADVEAKAGEVSQASEACEKLKAELESMATEVTQLNEDRKMLRQELASKARDVTRAHDQCTTLQDDVDSETERLKASDAKCANLQILLDSGNEELTKAAEVQRELRAALESKTSQLAKATEESSRLGSEAKCRDSELAAARQECSDLRKQLAHVKCMSHLDAARSSCIFIEVLCDSTVDLSTAVAETLRGIELQAGHVSPGIAAVTTGLLRGDQFDVSEDLLPRIYSLACTIADSYDPACSPLEELMVIFFFNAAVNIFREESFKSDLIGKFEQMKGSLRGQLGITRMVLDQIEQPLQQQQNRLAAQLIQAAAAADMAIEVENYHFHMDGEYLVVIAARGAEIGARIAVLQPSCFRVEMSPLQGCQLLCVDAPIVGTWSSPCWSSPDDLGAALLKFDAALR
jgi:hypothetical protein